MPAPRTRPAPAPWTEDRLRDLGVVTDLPTAAKVFGLGRALAYQLARDGTFPVPVLCAGKRYRVPVAAILAALHLAPAPDSTAAEAATAAPSGDSIAPAWSGVDHDDIVRSAGRQSRRAAPPSRAPSP